MIRQEFLLSRDYAQAAAAIIAAMPLEQAAQVYDFARFLQAQGAAISPIGQSTDDWLQDSEDQMQAEDMVWDAFYARHGDRLLALREAARYEIDAGVTEDMFDENGDLAL